ncbi:hypothetical protein SH2C18_37910 [Clostridium sediminicola]|uniref:YecA family protein n=1 Tax=Clostridium sediminicola TaxID=3114879 RepID=UPI0031F20581
MSTERNLIFKEIDLNLTYEECLIKLKKDELIEIRKHLKLTNVSKLKKADLVEVLGNKAKEIDEEYITGNLIYDAYKALKTIIEKFEKGQGNYIPYNEDMYGIAINLKELGLAFYGTIEDNLKIIIVPINIMGTIKDIVKSKEIEEYMLQRKKYTILIAAYIHYYGIINKLDLEKIIETSFDSIDLANDINYNTSLILEDKYGENFKINSPYIYHVNLENILSTLKEQTVRKELEYYPLTPKLFEEHYENNFNFQGEELYSFLVGEKNVDEVKAKTLIWEFIFRVQNSVETKKAIEILTENIELNGEEEKNKLRNLVNGLSDNLRMWNLKGNTPKEIREKFQKKSKYTLTNRKPLPVTKPIRREKKIGRNEKCPCGSGKKYKKCCG